MERQRPPPRRLARVLHPVRAWRPILVIAIAIAGFFFGAEAVRGEVVSQIRGLVGETGAQAVQAMLESAAPRGGGMLATVIGLVTFFLGATGAFLELQTALNAIWRVKPKPERRASGRCCCSGSSRSGW